MCPFSRPRCKHEKQTELVQKKTITKLFKALFVVEGSLVVAGLNMASMYLSKTKALGLGNEKGLKKLCECF